MAGVKALLIFPVTTLHLAVVSWRVGTDQLVPNAQIHSSDLKQSGQVLLAVRETVGELKAIVRLDTFHADASAGVPLEQLLEEISRRKGVLLRIGSQEAQVSELVYGGILEQAQLRVCNTPAGLHFHIYLDPLAGVGHLLVRLWFIHFF